jgi:hypothetical protein
MNVKKTVYPHALLSRIPTQRLAEAERRGTALLPCRGSTEDQRSRFLAYGSEQHVRGTEASSRQTQVTVGTAFRQRGSINTFEIVRFADGRPVSLRIDIAKE